MRNGQELPPQEDTGNKPRLKKRGYVYFPEGLKYVASTGTGRFVTRIEHRLPDGTPVVWTSRRHRKARGLKTTETKAQIERPELRKASKPQYVYWGYRPRAIAWWIASLFTFGSIFFMIGALPEMFPAISGNEALDTYVKVSFFIGSVFFTVAGYVQLIEAMNVDLDISTDVQAVIDQRSERSTGQPVKQVRKLYWFKWRGDRLGFLASFVQSMGTVVFNVNCFFAIFIGLGWVTEDLLVWVPSTIASTLFISASYIMIMEVSHGRWSWNYRQISWWISICSLMGSIGFFVSSIFGFFGQGPILIGQEWSANFVLLLGCIFFLMSSYLMLPEMLNKQTETGDIASA